ncbi:transposase family protein [Xenorhabdus japonica]|uniref:transposase family protein n=1 Tax=Xenorhabdus japonica TaxID=53341 RepID=UPI000A72C856|nr:transposase family protein [Xenorhabdus japonica]
MRLKNTVKPKEDWFRQFLDLPNGIPSHDIFNDVINRLDSHEFRHAFTQWVNNLAKISDDIIALDSKTLQGIFVRIMPKPPCK